MLSYSDEMKLYIQLCHSSKAYLIYNSKKLYVPEYAFQAYTKLFVSKFEQLINLSVIAICPVSQWVSEKNVLFSNKFKLKLSYIL